MPPGALRRVILTASGGAFRDFSTEELIEMNAKDPEYIRKKATTHPNWDMGAKITVDSATMMNKGLEVIEAHYLFGTDYDDIDVVVHPQSIIHSGIETSDSSVICQLGWPDMRLPILYSMSWPHRLNVDYGRGIDEKFDLVQLGSMSFKAPDVVKYPCIPLAFAAGRQGAALVESRRPTLRPDFKPNAPMRLAWRCACGRCGSAAGRGWWTALRARHCESTHAAQEMPRVPEMPEPEHLSASYGLVRAGARACPHI